MKYKVLYPVGPHATGEIIDLRDLKGMPLKQLLEQHFIEPYDSKTATIETGEVEKPKVPVSRRSSRKKTKATLTLSGKTRKTKITFSGRKIRGE
jgi:hypothetical protein